jgi:hypothetical protein
MIKAVAQAAHGELERTNGSANSIPALSLPAVRSFVDRGGTVDATVELSIPPSGTVAASVTEHSIIISVAGRLHGEPLLCGRVNPRKSSVSVQSATLLLSLAKVDGNPWPALFLDWEALGRACGLFKSERQVGAQQLRRGSFTESESSELKRSWIAFGRMSQSTRAWILSGWRGGQTASPLCLCTFLSR